MISSPQGVGTTTPGWLDPLLDLKTIGKQGAFPAKVGEESGFK